MSIHQLPPVLLFPSMVITNILLVYDSTRAEKTDITTDSSLYSMCRHIICGMIVVGSHEMNGMLQRSILFNFWKLCIPTSSLSFFMRIIPLTPLMWELGHLFIALLEVFMGIQNRYSEESLFSQNRGWHYVASQISEIHDCASLQSVYCHQNNSIPVIWFWTVTFLTLLPQNVNT